MRRHTLWALSTFFVAVGLALSVSLVVSSETSRARESVLKSSIAERLALPQAENNAAFSQYVETSPPVPLRAPRSSRGLPEPSQRGSSDSEHFVSQGSIASGSTLREEHFPPYSQVIDNSAPRRFKAAGWTIGSSNLDGYRKDYHLAKPSGRTKPARFRVKIPATDTYSVYAWWPARKNNNAAARFGIRTTPEASGTK